MMLVSLLVVPGISQAIYRCIDNIGNTTFSQLPCAPGQEAGQVDIETGDEELRVDPAVCEEIRRLAVLIFPHIHTEESILTVYDKLGGRAGLSAGVTSAINYVYNFRYNPQAKQDLVVRLTHEKCLEKGFGIIRRDELPDWARFTYEPDKAATAGERTGEQGATNSNCVKYQEDIRKLTVQLRKAQSKSDELRLQADKEHMEFMLREHCN